MENIPLSPKTTMRIGGAARYYLEIATQRDAEDAVAFAEGKKLPLVMLGGGSNTVFADLVIEAVVARVSADGVMVRQAHHDTSTITVAAGKILASLLNELAEQHLDLSPLTGIPGTVGGAIFGNAGQGFDGIWIGSFVKEVTFYHEKQWKTWTREECGFGYRDSTFKNMSMVRQAHHDLCPPVLWSITLSVPSRPKEAVLAEIEILLRRRIATQPHLKTAGSCFKSLPDGTPAWKLIDAKGLRGFRIGDIQVAAKHANFLLNVGKASFADATALVARIRSDVGSLAVEMRFVGPDGSVIF